MDKILTIRLPQLEPVQQGSKVMAPKRGSRACRACGKRPMVLVDAADMSTTKGQANRLKRYREAVAFYAKRAALNCDWEILTGGVALQLELVYGRPTSHLKKCGQLRKGKPFHKTSKPDLDKLLRAVGDALSDSGKIWTDDSQMVQAGIAKRYAGSGEEPGVLIKVSSVECEVDEDDMTFGWDPWP